MLSFGMKFSRLKIILLLALMALLGACATMDIASFETAETVARGKGLILMGTGNGFNLNYPTGLSHYDDGHTLVGTGLSPWVTTGSLGIGLGKQFELSGRIHLLSTTWGIKATLKKQLFETIDGYSMAILAGGTATSYGGPSGPALSGKAHETHYVSDEYDSYGTELQLIGSKRWNPTLITSLIAKGNSTMRKAEINERIYHGGIRINLKAGTQQLNIIPELGMDFYLDKNDKPVLTHRFAIGLSMQY